MLLPLRYGKTYKEKEMERLLIYYGWLNSFNSAVNQWNNEKVAQEMARYGLLVFGSGIESTSHGDNTNINVILPRIKVLNPNAKIYGYVTVSQSYANFCSKVDDWVDNRDVDGIFFDEAGYGEPNATVANNSRLEMFKKVTYVKNKGLSCFINAWKIEHILGTNEDVSYPDSTWNQYNIALPLDDEDWYLLESFAIDSSDSFEAKATWKSRGDKTKEYCAVNGVNVAAIGCIDEDGANAQDHFDFIYTSALMFTLDAVASGDYKSGVAYGASNAKTKFYDRPDNREIYEWDSEPAVINDGNDADVYIRYFKEGKASIDFSSSAETCSITKY